MDPITLFVRRPVMTTIVAVAIVLAGVAAYRALPVSDLPTVDFPTVTVSASLPGASPETMASSVALPLEKSFSAIPGITDMSSSSSLGSTSITLQFDLDRDIDAAAQDVNAAISGTLRQLPQGMIPPSYQKVNPAMVPILYITLTSSTLQLSDLDEIAETQLAQRISTVSGVASVDVLGTQKRAVRIRMDPRRLWAAKLAPSDVAQAVAAATPNIPSGTLWGAQRATTVQADGQLFTAAPYDSIAVAWRNGAPIRLRDVATAADGVQNDKTASWYGEPATRTPVTRSITLAVNRQPGTNTVQVADAVKALVPQLAATVPAGVSLNILYDRSVPIREGVADVEGTLLLTLALVVFVVFLFLRSPRATLVPSLALPLSVAGTFAIMRTLGYSLDNLSLMALTLAVGFVVDDAIVVLENIVRHRERGAGAMQAALDGAREVGFTVLSMTLSLAAVFLPLLVMPGVVGRLFREFAVVIAVSILVSGLVSLTITPMLASRFLGDGALHDQAPRRLRPLLDAFERGYEATARGYARTLAWSMAHRRVILAGCAVLLVLTGVLFTAVPSGFLPSDDNSFLQATTEGAQGASFESMVAHQRQLAAIVAKDPNVAAFVSSVGSSRGLANQGRLVIRLRPPGERTMTADEVARALTRKLNGVPGMQAFVQNPPTLQIGGLQSKALYQFTLQGTDPAVLYPAAQRLQARLQGSALLADVTSDLLLANPTARIVLDRDRAASLGVAAQDVEQALYDAFGMRQVSTIYTPTNQYWVILETDPALQGDPGVLSLYTVKGRGGTAVPLSSVTATRDTTGPMVVAHKGQVTSVTISFNLRPGVALSQASQLVQAEAARALPAGILTGFSGTAQAFRDSQAGLGWLFLLAVAVIYGILAMLYESFVHPVTILSGLPFAVFGALASLWLFRLELSLYAVIGLVLLVGLVKKNAIMMVDVAVERERTLGEDAATAMLAACALRFRPITMTTLAALVGTLPIALGLGAGAASRRGLGVAVVGGLAFSQVVTLYVTPVLYTYFDALQQRLSHASRPEGGLPAPAPVPV